LRSWDSRAFFRLRVAVLLFVLASVLLFAWNDARSRRARKDWDHTLQIAVVLLRAGPVADDALDALRARASALEGRLQDELHRYRPGAPAPFAFTVAGPVDVASGPPRDAIDGVVDLVAHTFRMWRYVRVVDRRAGIAPRAFDARIYVTARTATHTFRQNVEGASKENGRIGTVDVEFDPDPTADRVGMADFALFVVAHEVMHTLGATDKYDATGRVLLPDGLAEPDREPLWPQRFAEVMARNRPIYRRSGAGSAAGEPADEEVVPESLNELAVGKKTAEEIGWARAHAQ
jgi:hypothetical protein